MARAGDQVRASDVTVWGIAALVCWAIAIFGANVAALIPSDALSALHASRIDSANLTQLRTAVVDLQQQAADLRQQNVLLLQRFTLNEQGSGEVRQRVAALELALPRLADAAGDGSGDVDRGAITASTGSTVTSFDADGGSVSFTTTPLPGTGSAADQPAGAQPMPQLLGEVTPDAKAFGVALGPPVDELDGPALWQHMTAKVGTLLIGLGPLLADVEGGGGKRLVMGPIPTQAAARQLCGQMAKVGVACATMSFTGAPLPRLY